MIRTGLGMDRKELATGAGLSYSYLAEIENGRKPASASAQHAIARALSLSPSELLAAAEEWAAHLGDESPPRSPVRLGAPLSRILSIERGRRPQPGHELGARERQERWLVASSLPRGSRPSAPERDDAALEEQLRELRTLLASLSPQDRERVLDLARRLARK